MYFVVNQDNIEYYKNESFELARKEALKMKAELGENFNIFKYEWVWSTKTLAELHNK